MYVNHPGLKLDVISQHVGWELKPNIRMWPVQPLERATTTWNLFIKPATRQIEPVRLKEVLKVPE